MQGTRVDSAVVIIEARLSVNLNSLTIEQVISKMLRSHTNLVDSLVASLEFAGAPKACLQPLLSLKRTAKARGREFFNEPSLFVDATQEALNVKRACVEMVGETSSWDDLADVPEALAARLRSSAELLAAEEKPKMACRLLMRAVEICPPSAEAVARVDALCRQQLISPTSDERCALLALDYFLQSSGEDPQVAPWPDVVRKLAKDAGDSSGTGIAYAVTAAAHRAPGAIVKPQLFAAACTAKALKGSALLYAASVGDAAGVRAALEFSGSAEERRLAANSTMDTGVTPLMLACHTASLEAVQLLLAASAETNSTTRALDHAGCNALACAAIHPPPAGRESDASLVKALLAAKADVNVSHPDVDRKQGAQRKNTGINFPLLAAVTRGSDTYQNILALLRAGADANARDGFGMTALHHAVRADNGTNVKCLLGDATLPWATQLSDPSWPGSRSLEVDVVDENGGFTPLMYAAGLGSERFVTALLNAGAKVDTLRPGQLTRPLLVAADQGNVQIASQLLQSKADVNDKGADQQTALAIVSAYAEGSRLEVLLNAPGAQGQSALFAAAASGRLEMVKMLLAAGADITPVTHNGWSAYIGATVSGHTEIAKLLLSAGAVPWDMMKDGFPRETRYLGFRRAVRAGVILTELPASLGECKQLATINMNGCDQLQRLPASIGSCTALKRLSLRDCRELTQLPSTLGGLQQLETLDLTRCSALTALPDSLAKCASLKHLHVDGCVALSEASHRLVREVMGRSSEA